MYCGKQDNWMQGEVWFQTKLDEIKILAGHIKS